MDIIADGGFLSAAFAAGVIVVLFGAFVQSATGIGFGLIAAPVLLLIDPKFVPGTVIFLGTAVSFLSAVRDVRHINGAYVAAGIAGRIPAAILAASLVAGLSQSVFQIVFACLILFAVALSLLGRAIQPSMPGVAVAGVLSGLMGTLTSVGGPPFALALQNAPAHQLRATLNAVLLLGACVSMASLAAFGSFGWPDMLRGLALVPSVLLGFYLARYVVHDPRNARWQRTAVLGICVVASVVLLMRAIGGAA